MKATFLAMGLLGAVLASTVVFADDTTTATTPAVSGQQAPAVSGTTAPAPAAPATSATQSGTGQVSQ